MTHVSPGRKALHMNRAYMERQIAELQSMLNRGAYDRHPFREDRDLQIAEILEEAPSLATLSLLLTFNPISLGEQGRIDYMVACERHSAWLQPTFARGVVAVAGNGGKNPGEITSEIDQAEREEVATALRISPTSAQNRIDVARILVNHLPQTCLALAHGDISPIHATVIARETAPAIRDGVPEQLLAAIETAAIAHAEFHTPGQVGKKVRTQLAQLNPQEFEEIAQIARANRKVSCYEERNGVSTVVAILPAEDAQIVMRALESFIAKQENSRLNSSVGARGDLDIDNAQSDERTMDMKRADALTQIAELSLITSNEDTAAHRRPFTVNITIDLPTLLGLKENPAQLAGYGPIPAQIARELAMDSKWKRFITDPITGALLDYGRESYEPPQALVDFVIARDRTCRFPGCRSSATRADIDHAIPWEQGGKTSADNLGLLCRRHHRMKTHGGWHLVSHSDGSCDWTSPQGKKFHVPARPLGEAV